MSEPSNNILGEVVRWQYNELARERLGGSGSALKVPSRHIGGSSSMRNLKRIAISAIDCALAHWYMVPGLRFQRFRLRFEIGSLFRKKRLPASVRSLVLDGTPDPASYLGFHFASQFLNGRTLGNYLDVSSPWLFPFALLSNLQAANVTLLAARATGLKSLTHGLKEQVQKQINCVTTNAPLEDECYDTITSLWNPNEKPGQHIRDVRSLKRILKPGGTLLLSVPCTSQLAEVTSINGEQVYDANALEQYVFDVLGQPKRYVIYGAQARHCDNKAYCFENDYAADRWFGSSVVGRDWRCYSSLQELPAVGVIVMKFIRRESEVETVRWS
jgi:hypothetical protein